MSWDISPLLLTPVIEHIVKPKNDFGKRQCPGESSGNILSDAVTLQQLHAACVQSALPKFFLCHLFDTHCLRVVFYAKFQ